MQLIPWRTQRAWSPLRDLETLQSEVNKFFNFPTGRWVDEENAEMSALVPAMDVAETKTGLRITAEVPGIDKKDLSVEVDGNRLVIKGEKKREENSEQEGVVRTERSFGSFYRAVTLPTTVDAAKIEASYKNGVLTLHLPKREEAKPRQIAIEVKEN